MEIQIMGRAGHSPIIEAKDYTLQYPACSSTQGCIDYIQKQLLQRQEHCLSAVELKHSFSCSKKDSGLGPNPRSCYAHDCIYLVLDKNARELLTLVGMAKGYSGEGSRGAATLDAYLDLMNIPIKRVILVRKMVQKWNGKRIVEAPAPVKPELNLEHLVRVKRRAKEINIKFRFLPKVGFDKFGFDKLYERMPIEEMLNAVDFYHYGFWG